MAEQQLTLEQVQTKFENWRKTRVKRGKIPDDLWLQAIELTKTIKTTTIAYALRLNHSDFKAKTKSLSVKALLSPTKSSEKPVTFLQVNQEPAQNVIVSEGTLIELKRSDGTNMSFKASSLQVRDVIEIFLGKSSCCN